jgi:hypothetical protein
MRHPIEELQATLDEMLEYEQVLLLYMAEVHSH